MSNRRIAVTVLVTTVIVAILAAGGYALFRLGYVRGVSESAGGIMMRGFDDHFGDDRGMPFHEFANPGRLHERMPMAGFSHPGFRSYSPLSGFSGLLLFIGVVALVVIAINGLSGKDRQGTFVEPSQMAADPRPRRRTRKEATDN